MNKQKQIVIRFLSYFGIFIAPEKVERLNQVFFSIQNFENFGLRDKNTIHPHTQTIIHTFIKINHSTHTHRNSHTRFHPGNV